MLGKTVYCLGPRAKMGPLEWLIKDVLMLILRQTAEHAAPTAHTDQRRHRGRENRKKDKQSCREHKELTYTSLKPPGQGDIINESRHPLHFPASFNRFAKAGENDSFTG
ncbi:unnamed protein product [Pleuronectes platessa]|uniref:Uncharacterized protein n=1 Tax=Pleuronectes platessa TaxID=8262 RepID=A0A9N7UQ07_PLEPL|nr:unnamed protein product [Pleuronectes platessa]